MSQEQMAEWLATHTDGGGSPASTRAMDELPERDRHELASLVRLAQELESHMRLLQAPSVFAQSLRQELLREAERRMVRRRRRRRVALIGGAVAGVVVSIASLVGGIVVLVKWLRTRTEARQASTA